MRRGLGQCIVKDLWSSKQVKTFWLEGHCLPDDKPRNTAALQDLSCSIKQKVDVKGVQTRENKGADWAQESTIMIIVVIWQFMKLH